MSFPTKKQVREQQQAIPSYDEVMSDTAVSDIPSFDDIMGEKKNQIGNDLNNGTQNTSLSKSSSLLEKSVSAFKMRPISGRINPDGTAILKNPNKLYNESDDEELSNLSSKYNTVTVAGINNVADIVNRSLGIPKEVSADVTKNPYTQKLREVEAVESSINKKILEKQLALNTTGEASLQSGQRNSLTPEEDNELNNLQTLKRKLSVELTVDGMNETDAILRTDQSGTQLNKFITRAKMAMGDLTGAIEFSQETEDKISKLPTEFFTGLNYYKNAEPVVFERLTNSIKNNLPISDSQVAQVTAEGLAIEEARLERQANKSEIAPEEFNTQIADIQKRKVDNLLGSKETLRAALSNGIAEQLDAIERTNQGDLKDVALGALGVGFRWNYDDKEIQSAGEKWASQHGLDPSNPNVQSAIKYLQDNEGAMIMKNSIAKSGAVREFSKGLAEPIRGISASIESAAKNISGNTNDIYVEGQSQGNVNVSEQRLKAEDVGWRGVVNDVTKGAGQFATQAAIALGTSGVIGAVGESVGSIASGSRLVELAAGEIGNSINVAKDFAATLTTSFAQVYDSNLKTALNYTSDNQVAKNAAFINSTIEGLSENILSPIDIVRGIKIFKTPSAQEGLIKVLSEKNILSNPSALNNFLRSTLNVGLGTTKVAGTEIAEEYVTQIADFTTNAFLNPNSKSFQDRDLVNELAQTAYQTGLSMAIPALANGIGAGNVNSFAKGSLMIAAQNRQSLIDNLTGKLADKSISEDEYNRKVSIINTAAKANETLPLRADNTPLNSDEKADYVFSRVSEGVMQKKMEESNDEAEKQIFQAKIKEQQDFRTQLLTTNDNAPLSTDNGVGGNNETISQTNDGSLSTNGNDITSGEGQQVNEGNVTAAQETETNQKGEPENISQPIELNIEPQAIPIAEVGDAEYNDFIDKNKVLDLRLNDIADKVKNKQPLSERENAIFVGKTAEINKIIAENNVVSPSTENKIKAVKNADGTVTVQSGTGFIKARDEAHAESIAKKLNGKLEFVDSLDAPTQKETAKPLVEDTEKSIKSIVDKFDNEENYTIEDLVNDAEVLAETTGNKKISDAVEEYRKAQEEDRKLSGRGDMDSANDAVEKIIRTESENKPIPNEGTPIERAKQIANDADIKGFTATTIKDAAKNDEAAFVGYLKDIAEQSQDPNSSAQTVRTYGQELVDIANELNPKNGTTSSTVNEPVSTDEKQSTGQGTETPISGTITGDNGGGATSTTSVPIKKYTEKAKSVADKIRNAELPQWLINTDPNTKQSGLSGNALKNALADAVEAVGKLLDAGVELKDAINTAFTDFKKVFTDANEPFDEKQLKSGFKSEMEGLFTEDTPETLAAKIKNDEINYDDAIEGKSQEFIKNLDKALFGSDKFKLNEEGFRKRVRDQKDYGISEADIVANYEAIKKLTKRQKEIIGEVFGETAATDKEAKELQEAFKQLAKGEKPKAVLKRLGISDVTHLVKALSDFLGYKAVSNVQLEAMADYIVDSIELDKSDKYINAMIDNGMADVKQLLRAKMIVALQDSGNEALATQLVNDMANDAVSSGRQTQSLKKAYEILGAKGNPKMRTAFQVKYAESVQKKALEMNKKLAEMVSNQEAEIGRLNERIHNATQKSSAITKIKELISNLCNLRGKK